MLPAAGCKSEVGACDNPGTSPWERAEGTFEVCWDKGIVYRNKCYASRKFSSLLPGCLTFLVIMVATGKQM